MATRLALKQTAVGQACSLNTRGLSGLNNAHPNNISRHAVTVVLVAGGSAI
jgi:hypothetical protein